MAHHDQGGSAFPYSFTTMVGEEVYDSGMTLRDWFAGQVILGLVVNNSTIQNTDAYARLAYQQADAMIRERGEVMEKHKLWYPNRPGFKDTTVSKENATTNRKKFGRMKRIVLDLFESGFTGTTDEVAGRLNISILSARPRCTELLKAGLIERVRIDRSMPGSSMWVLRLATGDNPFDASERPEGYYHTALEPPEEAPYDDGQPDERQEWFDFDPDC